MVENGATRLYRLETEEDTQLSTLYWIVSATKKELVKNAVVSRMKIFALKKLLDTYSTG